MDGLSDARNVGIEFATGKYIGFIDSDDYIEPDMFENLYNLIKNNSAEISICNMFIEFENGNKIVKKTKYEKLIMSNEEALIHLNSFSGFDMSVCTKLFKTELFKDLKFPYGLKCEDYYIIYKLFSKASKVVFSAKPYYHYLQRNGSITKNVVIDDSFVKASKSQVEFFENNYPHMLYIANTAYAFANIAVYNKYIKKNVNCDKSTLENLKGEVKKNIKNICKNPYISIFKKVQAIIFIINTRLYRSIIKTF